MANTDRSYSPADICAIFNIAKSTLFRWEQDGFVDRIPRDLRDRRVYKKSHLGSIAKHLFREQYQAAARNENRDSLAQLHESMALMKVIAGDPMGLRELAEFPALSTPTMRELLRFAAEELDPVDEDFARILDLVRRCVPDSAAAAAAR